MSITELLILVAVGLLSGVLAGLLGVGGGIIIIPALVFILGLSQHQAQGTSLAFMLPPVGILAVWNYHKAGYINWQFALVLAITFFIGAYFGSRFVMQIPDRVLKKIFGILMLFFAFKLIFSK
ncbi:MAG TPA: sulfite exporter TauE/SafE family protein [Prolixibacteraceae bacterium]|nr:sulfite exporter TauE/SafE family protein [Prolixibacteraceae bacterium]